VCQYQLSHLSDGSLLSGLKKLVAQDCATTAELLAHLAEIDDRKLYLPAAYPSMYLYCVRELHLSEDSAYKRIQAARAARQFPAIFEALAGGRLHLSAVCLLAPHLREGTAEDLLAAATHKSKAEIELLLAERFPRPDVLAWVQESSTPAACPEHLAAGPVEAQHAPGQVPAQLTSEGVNDRPQVKPLGPQSFHVQFTFGQGAHEKLRHAQELLSHRIPAGDVAALFERALDALIPKLEKQRFAATSRPRPNARRSSANSRHIPAHVRRAVWERDGGQCTFVGENGRRCPAREPLEFDHVLEVARGGEAAVSGIRLRCRAHNQYTAERTFGAGFMERKRQEAGRRRERLVRRQAACQSPASVAVTARSDENDVVHCLRHLGFRADEVRRAVAASEALPDASLEEQVRFALSYLRPPHRQVATGSP
jgi:hypothetical protein